MRIHPYGRARPYEHQPSKRTEALLDLLFLSSNLRAEACIRRLGGRRTHAEFRSRELNFLFRSNK